MNTKNNTNAFKKYFLHSDNDKFDAIAIVDSEENACIFYADQLSPKPDKPLSKMSYSELCGFDFSFLDGCSTSQEVLDRVKTRQRRPYKLNDIPCTHYWIIPDQPLLIKWSIEEKDKCIFISKMEIDMRDILGSYYHTLYAEYQKEENPYFQEFGDHEIYDQRQSPLYEQYISERLDDLTRVSFPYLLHSIRSQLNLLGLPVDIAKGDWNEQSFKQFYGKFYPNFPYHTNDKLKAYYPDVMFRHTFN